MLNFVQICDALKASGYDVVACNWHYRDGANFSTRISVQEDKLMDATVLGAVAAMIQAQPDSVLAQAVFQAELGEQIQLPDNYFIMVCRARDAKVVVLIHIEATPEMPAEHLYMDVLREIVVSWSNTVHKSKLVWTDDRV